MHPLVSQPNTSRPVINTTPVQLIKRGVSISSHCISARQSCYQMLMQPNRFQGCCESSLLLCLGCQQYRRCKCRKPALTREQCCPAFLSMLLLAAAILTGWACHNCCPCLGTPEQLCLAVEACASVPCSWHKGMMHGMCQQPIAIMSARSDSQADTSSCYMCRMRLLQHTSWQAASMHGLMGFELGCLIASCKQSLLPWGDTAHSSCWCLCMQWGPYYTDLFSCFSVFLRLAGLGLLSLSDVSSSS